ncbi:MAG: outer membrane lipoprotein-sorting protein [Spirochaetales bacterium]|nr:outer membrane lipoprotein-sorting protein [Spirochaetales bacterium]
MTKRILLTLLFLASLTCPLLWSQDLSAAEILERVDRTISEPEDQQMEATLILIDDKGNERTRVIEMYQKGAERRLARFTEPADQRGIAVLSLPGGNIYVYLPAYRKVKRIASHVKNSRFAGTDFTYEDMEAKSYSKAYQPSLLRTESDHFVLELIPEDRASEYSKLVMRVRKDTLVADEIEYYDKAVRACKRLTSSNFEKIDGYWVAREQEMVDLMRNHRTRMIMRDIRFDQGLSEDLFSERQLAR